MALQDLGHQLDPQSASSYVASATGLAVSGLTLLELISVGVGIALGVVSIITVVLTYLSVSKKNRAQREVALAQLEALQRANQITSEAEGSDA